jgi:tRNA nucleotidyltransferase (CCA-adding enzyme)
LKSESCVAFDSRIVSGDGGGGGATIFFAQLQAKTAAARVKVIEAARFTFGMIPHTARSTIVRKMPISLVDPRNTKRNFHSAMSDNMSSTIAFCLKKLRNPAKCAEAQEGVPGRRHYN